MKTILHTVDIRKTSPSGVYEAQELSDEEYGRYNYNWGFYLESLRLLVETGTGKPYLSVQNPRGGSDA